MKDQDSTDGAESWIHSCLMQDEPETGTGFSYKMSLKGGGIGMLGVGHQHGRFGSRKPGADPGILGGEWRGPVRGVAASRDVQLGGADAGTPRVRQAGSGGQGIGAAVRGADDGAEPGASDAAD